MFGASFHSRDMTLWFLLLLLSVVSLCGSSVPCVAVGTWHFSALAIDRAREILESGGTAVDAAEKGVNALEIDTSEQTFVGYGGLPNSDGDMELDAAIMDGERIPGRKSLRFLSACSFGFCPQGNRRSYWAMENAAVSASPMYN